MAEGTLHTQLWPAILHRRVNGPINRPERQSTAVLPQISRLQERCEHIDWGRTLLRGKRVLPHRPLSHLHHCRRRVWR